MMDFNQALDNFITECQSLVDHYWESMGFNSTDFMRSNKPVITKTEGGKRYIRLVKFEHGKPSSVYCFVDTTNGDVLKGSWKAPVKNGVRGNIFKGKAADYMTNYGPAYLR